MTLIDTKRERDIDLGAKFPYVPIERGNCIVHGSWKELYGLSAGESIEITLIVPRLLELLAH